MARFVMKLLATSGLFVLLIVQGVLAQDAHVQPILDYIDAGVKGWIADPIVIATLRARNAENRSLSSADILALDQRWRQDEGHGTDALITDILSNPLSAFLKQKQAEAHGLITEIIVMDNRGLDAGLSNLTSDYWQGDEPKWTKSFGAGPGAVFVDKVQQDDSTQLSQSQASMTISDPDTGQPIGAITLGINLDAL